MNPAFWREWHRWIGFPAALFLLFASITGMMVAWYEFFGADEALREANRKLVSPVTLQSTDTAWRQPIARAFAAGAAAFGGSPVDKVTIQFKGANPTVEVFTGKPTGGEDRKLVFDAATGRLLKTESYADKPFIHRLHSGEVFGDGGLVVAMVWGLALALLTITGIIIYVRMWRPNLKGIERVFW